MSEELRKEYEELTEKDAKALKEDALKELSDYEKEQALAVSLAWQITAKYREP